VQRAALAEFDAFVSLLVEAGVEVCVIQDEAEPRTPDAVFPNNWISFHAGARAVLYPMQSGLRRQEVRADVLELVGAGAGTSYMPLDLTGHAARGRYLEGTGSMVLDREARVAYACLSARTDEGLVRAVCAELGYEPVVFDAADEEGRAIYHTNVMLAVGPGFAIVCSESIDAGQRAAVLAHLAAGGREIIEISRSQMACYLGNVLALEGARGPMIVLSRSAEAALEPEQRTRLRAQGEFIVPDLETIECYGGGSARCMLAEVVDS